MKNNFKCTALIIFVLLIISLARMGTAKASSITNFRIRIDPTVISTAPRVVVEALSFFDIDGSGRIELAEIFEVVKRWVDVWRGEGELKNGDLNGDGQCNLVDFSILLYYVGRI